MNMNMNIEYAIEYAFHTLFIHFLKGCITYASPCTSVIFLGCILLRITISYHVYDVFMLITVQFFYSSPRNRSKILNLIGLFVYITAFTRAVVC